MAFILLFNGPIAFAAFCAGLAAAKSGFFERGNVVYLALRGRLLLLLLLAVGLPLNAAYALSVSGLLGDGPSAALAFAGLSVGGPCLAAVYLVGAIEASRRGWFQGATAAAGRMSLTAYVTEGVLAGVVFNGYGLSLYGQVGLFGCFGIAVAIYAVTHTFAALWLRAFSHGPLEALLKAITRSGESAARRV